ncbi:putative protein YcgM [Halomonadaceae bacterium LMG 33818]|uniref:fumarylacetoacetate hydrolase family protein n=1 Tax=Cernens ardua TaxID=3402176 RepID=UPI003EDC9F2C
MGFYAQWKSGKKVSQPLGKIVCIGRNYAEHAAELDNPVPSQPLIFIKPNTSACLMEQETALRFDLGEIHYEAELAVLMGRSLTNAEESETLSAIQGVGLALDLTLRDRQGELKAKGHPWEVAKAFDHSCPMTPFIPLTDPNAFFSQNEPHEFTLAIDGEIRQHGKTNEMLFTIPAQLAYMSHYFTLEPGDIVLTGTPKGVGQLVRGQQVKLTLDGELLAESRLV